MRQIDLNTNVMWTEERENNLFFDPQRTPVTLEGTKTKWDMIYRQNGDSKFPISVKTGKYAAISNNEINRAIINHPEMQFSLDKRLSYNRRNSKFKLVYNVPTTPDKDFGDPRQDPNGVWPLLSVSNSYDGTGRLILQFGLFRYACSNMMIIKAVKAYTMTTKHYVGNFTTPVMEMIQNWISQMFSEETFNTVRGGITTLKNQTDLRLFFSMFRGLPLKIVSQILYNVVSFAPSTILYMDNAKGDAIRMSQNNVDKFLKSEYALDATSKEDKRFGNALDAAFQAKSALYNEQVTNQWLLYQLLLKVAHNVVKQENRMMLIDRFSQML